MKNVASLVANATRPRRGGKATCCGIGVEPSSDNGLKLPSQVMVDKPYAVAREKIGARIGRLDEQTLSQVNRSLMVWLALP